MEKKEEVVESDDEELDSLYRQKATLEPEQG